MKERRTARKRGNGEGTIVLRSDGRWCGAITWQGKRKFFYGATRLEVSKKITAATRSRDEGMPVPADQMSVDKFLQSWLITIKPSIKFTTWRRYRDLVNVHCKPTIGKILLPRLTPQHLQNVYQSRLDLGLSPTTVHHIHCVIHKALETAVRWDLVPRNVADLVDPPRIVRFEMKTLSAQQVSALLNAAPTSKMRAILTLAVTTGMRQGELLGLRWCDVDLASGTISIRGNLSVTAEGRGLTDVKTDHSRRLVRFPDFTKEALILHKEEQKQTEKMLGADWNALDLVFPKLLGGFWNSQDLCTVFHRTLESADLPRIRFHDLRHTAATLLLEKGIHPKIVSDILGHSTIAITLDTYSHVTVGMQEVAVTAMNDLLKESWR